MDTRITLISKENSYVNHIIQELRDEAVQQDRLRFRSNLEKVGMLLAFEMSRKFTYKPKEIKTVLGSLEMDLLEEEPVIVSILRAGVPLHVGFLKMFDRADNGFISAYRHHTKGNEFIVKVEYMATPSIEGRTLVLVDPMIATGRSLVLSYEALIASGIPDQVFIGGVIASEEGLDYVLRHIPKAKIFVSAVDKELTARGYIVPGLGDAGDLAFGPK